jgi:ABC-type Fe3+-hydroxamate transport system substrate-binding protein
MSNVGHDFQPYWRGIIMRVVSLVPSLTETLFALGLTTKEVVGRTPWCIHPQDMVDHVMVVGGTKTPNLAKIRSLNPDLIVMDKEENPLPVYRELIDDGFTIFVSEVKSPSDVPQMLRELGKACGKAAAGEALAIICQDSLNNIKKSTKSARTVPLIWHKPLMAVSPNKYPGAILSKVGFEVIDTNPQGNGYPEISFEEFIEHKIELILLTTEPHNFTDEEGISIAKEIVAAGGLKPTVVHIDGEDLTWFGARTAPALARLGEFCHQTLDTMKHQYDE